MNLYKDPYGADSDAAGDRVGGEDMSLGKKSVNELILRLQDEIADGGLAAGKRFPPERELAQRFGVSRNTVREAIQYFVMVGVASTKPGSGTYLVNDSEALKRTVESRQMMEVYNWNEIQQTRRIIEMGVVKLAAANANQEDKVRLRAALEKVKAAEKNVHTDAGIDAYLLADYGLHEEIARITHNTMLMELHASLRGSSLSLAKVWKQFANLVDVVNPTHKEIVAAVLRNDEDAAEAAMDAHLCYMEYRIKLMKTWGN